MKELNLKNLEQVGGARFTLAEKTKLAAIAATLGSGIAAALYYASYRQGAVRRIGAAPAGIARHAPLKWDLSGIVGLREYGRAISRDAWKRMRMKELTTAELESLSGGIKITENQCIGLTSLAFGAVGAYGGWAGVGIGLGVGAALGMIGCAGFGGGGGSGSFKNLVK